MSEIVRFSVSLEDDLLERFDEYCRREQFATRSEAVRQIIRRTLTAQAWQNQSGAGPNCETGSWTCNTIIPS